MSHIFTVLLVFPICMFTYTDIALVTRINTKKDTTNGTPKSKHVEGIF